MKAALLISLLISLNSFAVMLPGDNEFKGVEAISCVDEAGEAYDFSFLGKRDILLTVSDKATNEVIETSDCTREKYNELLCTNRVYGVVTARVLFDFNTFLNDAEAVYSSLYEDGTDAYMVYLECEVFSGPVLL